MNIQKRVNYYSPYDMSIPLNWQRAEVVINNYKNGWRPQDVCDVVELYNILLFIENDVAKKDWTEDDENKIEILAYLERYRKAGSDHSGYYYVKSDYPCPTNIEIINGLQF